MSETTLDNFDKKILQLMQNNCRMASEIIAEQVGLSASAVQRRIKRLRDEGAIKAEVAVIKSEFSTHPMTFIAGIEIDRDNYTVLNKFKRWAETQPSIQQVFYVTGNVDLMLVMTAENAKSYDRFIEHIMEQFPQIRRVMTNVVLDTPKQSLYLPVE
ncbi:Lrp/AsnC family transcriptional regulator [Vibrio sp. Y2-5]|uniref:Lrp/AsnC family transcriptional regulator n=1 Tax=Vibrio TaxID=662 RepID=UPI00142DEDE0|nr:MULTISPECIES: Lrp/AsnC family transcriptional regulator [Vibrio]MBD0786463.1 Lrp/AsnC family transcriptional regulator [Vibrio sp. Y2-5]NIY94335.1 Lrp/AsnC family transcriptional regulator [Vibrio diazotrophicus]